jgi:vancomycin permeability regulator SanA
MNNRTRSRQVRSLRILRFLLALCAVGLLVSSAALLGARHIIARQASDVHGLENSPSRPVTLVLGCAPTLPSGRENRYFRYRIDRAAELFHAGKTDYLLVSGDNSREDYDEPTAMKEALMDLGVPSDRIFIDYAGFSTLDSVVRAREVFGQDTLIIVTQPDHAMRALYIAEAKGIDAVGVAARDVGSRSGMKTRARESLARVKTILDVHVLNREPRFLGPEVTIAGTSHE